MANAKRALTIDDLWALKRFGTPTLSPDGLWACVAVTHYELKENQGTTQLWIFSTDGKTQRQLTYGSSDSDPQWSPNGQWIAFVARRGEGKDADEEAQLYVIAPDGGEAHRVTALPTGVSGPKWFPNSKRIAFISWVWPKLKAAKDQAKRYQAEKVNKVQARIVDKKFYRCWDHWIDHDRRPHLHSVDVDYNREPGKGPGKTRDIFAGTPYHLPPADPDSTLFDISPDGREIAFVHNPEADPEIVAATDIVVMDVVTRKAKVLTGHTGCIDEFPCYAPDGQSIAFISTDFSTNHSEQARLALVERATGDVAALSSHWDRGVSGPLVWSRDSRSLYFLAESEVAQPIWRLTLDDALAGKTPQEIIRAGGQGGVATDVRLSLDGNRLVYLRSTVSTPPAIFACSADGSGERAVESINAKLMRKVNLGEVSSVTVSGYQNEAVQMWVINPPNYNVRKRWPLFHMIHGGPHTCMNDSWHWRWNLHLFAASGWVVAAVNYHGSTGWGQQFVSAINGDWGRREMEDIEAGTEYLLANHHIDPARMVATGGSYGGYMVAYMNGRLPAQRYQAYVCHAGCYDWVAMMASDSGSLQDKEMGAFHWDDEQRVLQQSPHHYAASFTTPTLVTHGELDYRVPYYQGLAYYNTLRVRGIASRLVFFPDENHWILKPLNSRLWYREVLNWCRQHTEAA